MVRGVKQLTALNRSLQIAELNDSIVFSVRVIPRSSRTEIVGEHGGALKLKLKSPPVDGAANDELIRFLSKLIDVSRSDIEIVAGASSRTKRIRVSAADTSRIASILRAKI